MLPRVAAPVSQRGGVAAQRCHPSPPPHRFLHYTTIIGPLRDRKTLERCRGGLSVSLYLYMALSLSLSRSIYLSLSLSLSLSLDTPGCGPGQSPRRSCSSVSFSLPRNSLVSCGLSHLPWGLGFRRYGPRLDPPPAAPCQ